MKSLSLSYSDELGGAARAAYRNHTALVDTGVESTMWVRKKMSSDPTVRAGPPGSRTIRGRTFIEVGAPRLVGQSRFETRSMNFVPSRWSQAIADASVDVVNLNWIGSGTLSIEDVGRIRQPMVATLHDMWAFCGSEHYASDAPDARWRTGYLAGSAGSRGFDVDRWVWNRKQRAWRPMTVVCPSTWLARCVGDSALMRDWPTHVIPNALPVDVFAPQDRMAARTQLGIDPHQRAVLFGSLGGESERKGFDLLLESLERLASSDTEFVGVVVGEDEPADRPRNDTSIVWTGRIENDADLASAYSAADVVVVPSRQDNLPQIATEAQACGTPVVCFDTAGLPDIVVHKETGYLAEPFSVGDLVRGITWVVEDDDLAHRLGDAARRRAVELWSPPVVAAQYLDVFREATGGL